jgi:Uma2 family endonuclease
MNNFRHECNAPLDDWTVGTAKLSSTGPVGFATGDDSSMSRKRVYFTPRKACAINGIPTMGLPKAKPVYTEQEYLDIERSSDERYQYLDGDIFLMAGERLPHGDICSNLVGSLVPQLKGTPCRTLSKDTKIRSGQTSKPILSRKGLYSYPDIVVVCGEPEYHDDHEDVILNPKVIMEVLSPSTEQFDRGEKWSRYQKWNPSLVDYVLISQVRPEIQHFCRKKGDTWTFRTVAGLGESLKLSSIRCTIPLAEVFDRVTFSEDD